MTSNTDKLRAVFLTALMIGSVFAAGVAFTGSAAADFTGQNLALGDSSEGVSTYHNFSASANGVSGTANIDNITVDYSVDSTASDVSNVGDGDVNSVVVNGTTLSVSSVSTSNNGETAEFTLNESVNVTSGDAFHLNFSNVQNPANAGTYNVDVSLGSADTGSFSYDIAGTESAPDADRNFDGTGIQNSLVYAGQEVAVDVTTEGVTDGDDVVLRQGSSGDSTPAQTLTAFEDTNGDVYVVFDTSTLDTDDYFLTGTGLNASNTEFEIVEQTISADIDADSVTNDGSSTTLSVSSDLRNNYDGNITVAGFSDEDFADVFSGITTGDVEEDADGNNYINVADIEAGSPHTLNFDGIEAGNYTFDVTVPDTTAADNDTIEVTEAANANAGFVDASVNVDRGDVGTINVSLTNAETATVVLGSEESNYEVDFNVTDVDDDGYVAVDVNTYLTNKAGAVYTAAGDDEVNVHNESDLPNVLASSTYDMSVVQGNDSSADADALGTFTVEQRTAAEMNIWTAPAGASDIVASVSDDDTIASGDYVVHQVQTSGVFGLLASADGDDATEKLLNVTAADNLTVMVNQTEASTGANENPVELNLSAIDDNGGLTVVSNATSENVYIAVDTSEVETVSGDEVEIGDEFTAQFSVNTNTGLVSSNQTTMATFTIDEGADAGTEFDMDEVNVTNANNQTITGTTTLAAGTEFTVRVQSTETSGEPFIIPDDNVVVQDDGSFTAELDFSDTTVGSTFDARVRLGSSTLDTTSGNVVEQVDDTTTTTTADDTTTTTADDTTTTTADDTTTTTADDTTTTTAADTTTDGGDGDDGGSSGGSIPGFGVGIALVAILGAALLALRE